MTFRYKPGLGVPYEQQGWIYFTSRLYGSMPERVRREIESLCHICGGEHWAALMDFVTGDDSATAICRRHYISRSTLYRAVRRYYQRFPMDLAAQV